MTLSFLAIVLIFCLFFIRRHSLPYHFEHTFAVSDPEFVGSALALSDPVLSSGNKIDMFQNGDGYFPEMLRAILAARKTINSRHLFFIPTLWANRFVTFYVNVRAPV